MSSEYDIAAEIVILDGRAMKAIDRIEERFLKLDDLAKRLGGRISLFLGGGLRDVARGPDVRMLLGAFDRIDHRARMSGAHIQSALGRGLAGAGGGRSGPTPSGGGGGGGGVLGTLGGLAAVGGGAYAAASMAQRFLGLHTNFENAVNNVAAMVSVTDGVDMGTAQRGARGTVKLLAQDAATGVGGLDDYVETYQTLVGAGIQRSDEQMRELTKGSVTAGMAIRGQEGIRLAPMDIRQALEQGVNAKVTPIALAAVEAAGMSGAQFNQLDKEKKVDVLMKGFTKFGAAAEEMSKSWEARMATLQDSVSSLTRRLTAPLFERWSEQLGRVNAWMVDNEERLNVLVDDLGPRLVQVWDAVASRAELVGAALAGGGVAVGAAKYGAPLMQLGSGIGSLFGGASGAAGGAAGGGAALSALAAPLAVVGAAAGAAYAAFVRWPELWGVFADTGAWAWESLVLLKDSIVGAFNNAQLLSIGFESLAWVGWSVLVPFQQLGSLLGYALRGLGLVVEMIGFVVDTFVTGLSRAFNTIQMLVALLPGGDMSAGKAAADQFNIAQLDYQARQAEREARVKRLLGFAEPEKAPAVLAKKDAEQGAGRGRGRDTNKLGDTNIGKVEITVKSEVNADPARVAIAFDEAMGGLKRFRRQPRRVAGPVGA